MKEQQQEQSVFNFKQFEEAAVEQLRSGKPLEGKDGKKYPLMIKSWQGNWHRLSQYFKYPEKIRKMIYTTNMTESFHSQLRKVTETRHVFSSDDLLLKLLYLVFQNRHKG